MNYFNLVSNYPDPTIAAAWESQIKEADKTARLADTFKHCGNELFGRFATRYAELRALPRSARRALQRRLASSSELSAILPQNLQQGGRQLQHRMAWSLAGAAFLLTLGQGPVTAATITVTTSDPSIIADGQCSLIEAIINANNDAATHGDCAAGNGADTIVLPSNTDVMLSAAYVNTYIGGVAGLPIITSRITIEGNGAMIARQGDAPAFGLMLVANSGDLTLQSVTLSGGSSSGRGGGVFNYGRLRIKESTISGNTANVGGGTYNWYGNLTIQNSTVAGNTADQEGGGVNNHAGTVTIENSTISGNTANVGGGLRNTAYSYFGGSAATLTITNSTISGNHANQGGGVSNALVCYALFCYSGTLNLKNSVIAGNQATVAPEIENTSIVTANSFNLFGTNGNADVTGFIPGLNDIVPAAGVQIADILGPLDNNGGPTQTHALAAGSPAIDAGNPSGCRENAGAFLLTDQRGFVRNFDGNHDGSLRCDIGSVEYGAEAQGPPLVLAASRLLDAEIGVPYTSPSLITGGVQPYSIDVIAGAFPPGLIYDPVNNTIFGTPSSFGLKSFRLRITDQAGTSKTATFSVRILRAVGITTKTLPAAFNGRSYRARLVALGGKAPFSWSLLSGNMPQGLSLSGSTGVISGIPTVSGTFDLSFQVTDPMGGTANTTLILNIK